MAGRVITPKETLNQKKREGRRGGRNFRGLVEQGGGKN